MALGIPYQIGTAAPTANTNTAVISVGHAVAAGDAVAVASGLTGLTTSVSGITDTQGNTYTKVKSYNAAGSFSGEWWIALNCSPLSLSDSITVSYSASSTTHRISALGCSGVGSAAILDQFANASGTSTAPSTGATGTLATASELALALEINGSGGGAIAWGGGFTSLSNVQTGATEYLATAYKVTSSTAAVTASGTIVSAPWTALVIVLEPSGGGGGGSFSQTWYDATYSGWQALQATVPDPAMLAFGPAWTTAQIDTLPGSCIKMPLDDTGSHPSTTTVIDVESVDVTSASVIASWINARNALPGGYPVNRPTVYLNKHGAYYVGAASDVITPLANTYGLNLGVDYDLWLADTSGTKPTSSESTLGVPAVAIQYANYTQNGANFDSNVAFDQSWFDAFGSVPVSVTLDTAVVSVIAHPLAPFTAYMQTAFVGILAYPFILSSGIALPTAIVSVTAGVMAPVAGPSLDTATVTVTAWPLSPPRALAVSIAAKAGVDSFGNEYPAGLFPLVGQVPGQLIQDETITASKLTAGIVYAGIVDGTTIDGVMVNAGTFNGTNYIARGNGAWWYSGTPASGNLAASITDASRTDAFGNRTPPGGGFCTYNAANGTACQYSESGITFYTGSLSGGWIAVPNTTIDFDGSSIVINAGGPITIGGILTTDLVFVSTSQPLAVGRPSGPQGSASELEVNGAIGIIGRSPPGSPPSGMGYLYVADDHSLHYKGPSGTDTQIAPG